MFQFMALMLSLLAVFIIYSCNKNQQILKSRLSKKYKIFSYLCFILSLIMWSLAVSFSSAIFIWLMSMMLFLISVPALSLLKSKGQ